MVTTSNQSVIFPEKLSAQKIRVLLDARKWQDGGIGTYIRSLVRACLSREDIRLAVIVKPQDVFSFTGEFDPNLNLIDLELSDASGYSVKELLLMPRKIDWSKYDVYHSPHYTLPFGIPIPVVVTVHDLIHITHPEKAYYPLVAKRLISSALKRADLVLSVSNSSADEISEIFPNENLKSKLTILPNALQHEFVNYACDNSFALNSLISGEYLLSVVSGFKPHKGVIDLLKACLNLKQAVKKGKITNGLAKKIQQTKLVLVGSGSAEMLTNNEAMNLVTELDNVQVLGKVSRNDLLKLYYNATAVVVPSVAEGFGLPVLEAHAFGRPVIMRPVPALIEQKMEIDFVAGDFSQVALEAALLKYFESRKTKSENNNIVSFADVAKRQALTFSYEQMGVLLEKSYRNVLVKTEN